MRFNRALFKQCVKTNGPGWLIITAIECFMLATIMSIAGGSSLGDLTQSMKEAIISSEIDSYIAQTSLNFYDLGLLGEQKYDEAFAENFNAVYPTADAYTPTISDWLAGEPDPASRTDEEFATWVATAPTSDVAINSRYSSAAVTWVSSRPSDDALVPEWEAKKPTAKSVSTDDSHDKGLSYINAYFDQIATDRGFRKYSDGWLEVVNAGTSAVYISPVVAQMFSDGHIAELPLYDSDSLADHCIAGDADAYRSSAERTAYQSARSEETAAVLIATIMNEEKTISALIDQLEEFGLTRQTYESFGHTWSAVYDDCRASIRSYRTQVEYRQAALDERYAAGEITQAEYEAECEELAARVHQDVSASFLAKLPEDISNALQEIGKTDIYAVVVGSMFYKIAGLLLPIIYVVLTTNNLLAGAVDSGSLAYTLATGVKRETVTFTQASYLVLSLLAMVAAMVVTSMICFAFSHILFTNITFGSLALMNLAAFLTLFAFAGFCFGVSCFFDRSRFSLAVGGGLSIFALCATILGLFGSQVMPAVVRFSALNYFNYISIITLFDMMSITKMSLNLIWEFGILFVIGLAGFIIGSLHFKRKDLPL